MPNYVQDATDPFNAGEQRPVDPHRRAASRLDQRRHPGAVGHPGRAVLPLSLGAADAHVRGDATSNSDSNTNDITALAYQFTGLNDDGTATFEETGRARR